MFFGIGRKEIGRKRPASPEREGDGECPRFFIDNDNKD